MGRDKNDPTRERKRSQSSRTAKRDSEGKLLLKVRTRKNLNPNHKINSKKKKRSCFSCLFKSSRESESDVSVCTTPINSSVKQLMTSDYTSRSKNTNVNATTSNSAKKNNKLIQKSKSKQKVVEKNVKSDKATTFSVDDNKCETVPASAKPRSYKTNLKLQRKQTITKQSAMTSLDSGKVQVMFDPSSNELLNEIPKAAYDKNSKQSTNSGKEPGFDLFEKILKMQQNQKKLNELESTRKQHLEKQQPSQKVTLKVSRKVDLAKRANVLKNDPKTRRINQ